MPCISLFEILSSPRTFLQKNLKASRYGFRTINDRLLRTIKTTECFPVDCLLRDVRKPEVNVYRSGFDSLHSVFSWGESTSNDALLRSIKILLLTAHWPCHIYLIIISYHRSWKAKPWIKILKPEGFWARTGKACYSFHISSSTCCMPVSVCVARTLRCVQAPLGGCNQEIMTPVDFECDCVCFLKIERNSSDL